MDIDGTVLIVGAGGAIGRETALTLAAHGAHTLICADLNFDAAHGTARLINTNLAASEPGSNTHAMAVDTRDEASVQEMIDFTVQTFGRIDYFVNCSGFAPLGPTPLTSTSLQDYRNMEESHPLSTFLLLRAMLRVMQAQEPRNMPIAGRPAAAQDGESSTRYQSRGSIVILTSLASKTALAGLAPYIAAKHAVKGLVETAALEAAPHHIRANAVAPTFVATPTLTQAMDKDPEKKKQILDRCAYGRLVEVEEVADTIVWLAGQGARGVNGVSLVLGEGG